jgi:hypothetical protein
MTGVKWCCAQFQGIYDNAGRRGFSILVGMMGDEPAFLLVHRAVDDDDVVRGPAGLLVATLTHTGLLHCPWCGTRLAKFYRRSIPDLLRPAQWLHRIGDEST